jgi:hypothetical protein
MAGCVPSIRTARDEPPSSGEEVRFRPGVHDGPIIADAPRAGRTRRRLRRSPVMSGSSEGDPEGGERSTWVAGVVAQGGGEVDRPRPAEHADGQIAQAGHDLRAGAGADAGGVLAEGHIAYLRHRDRRLRGSVSASGTAWRLTGRAASL